MRKSRVTIFRVRHAHVGKGIVHEVSAVAWAFDPAFDGCVGGGVASGDVFANPSPRIAVLSSAITHAAAALPGMAEVVVRGHVVGVSLGGGGERAAPSKGASGIERTFAALAGLASSLVDAIQHRLLPFGGSARFGRGGCLIGG